MRPRSLLVAALLAAVSAPALAQDRITLANGDVLTGTIKTMADGKVTIASPLAGDVTVPLANIKDMSTAAQVELQTTGGDRLQRRIAGIEGTSLRLEGDTAALAIDKLAMINPPAVPEPSWTGSLKINALWTDGNTDRRSVGMAFDATLRRPDDRISVDAAWDYSEDKDNEQLLASGAPNPTFRQWKLNQRRQGGGLKYDYFLTRKWYALVTSRVLGDTLANIDLRFTAGVGVGYTWIEDSTTTFLTEVGVSYVNESYRTFTPPDPSSTDYVAARLAYKLVHAFSPTTRLVHSVEALPSTEGLEDFYLQGKTEIVTSLTDSMIASLAHVIDYDNTPVDSATRVVERVDNRVLLSVGWSF